MPDGTVVVPGGRLRLTAQPDAHLRSPVIVERRLTREEKRRQKRRFRKSRRKKASKPKRDGFYSTREWRAARYEALVRHGARCQACGATPADGVRINVDHIKPLKTHWDLRLDPENLQVLCGSCNAGKASRDTTDWRPAGT